MASERFELDDYRWLVGSDGRSRLDAIRHCTKSIGQEIEYLRRELSPGQARLILQQRELQRRAARRFSEANQMLFTDRSLQQATDDRLASYKAQRFATGQPVIDLGCGIGGDLMAIAKRGPACGIEVDPVLVCLARANLRATQISRAWVGQGDASRICIASEVGIHMDPDRRPKDRRSIQIQHHRPGPELIRRLVGHPAGCSIKLAPATDVADALLDGAELEWIGHGRQCQQLVAWYGPLTKHCNQRAATIIDRDGTPQTLRAETIPDLPISTSIGRFIVEPAPSVLAAGLASVVATRQQLSAVTAGGGYLTGDRASPCPWTRCFEVLDVMPYRTSRLKKWLKAENVGHLEVKHRGVKLDPSTLIRQLSLKGENSATLIVTQQGFRSIAIVARRYESEGQSGSKVPDA